MVLELLRPCSPITKFSPIFLPSAIAKRLYFHRCLSIHGGEVYTPWADTPHRQTPPPPTDNHCSGWYGYYWNAFLLLYKMAHYSVQHCVNVDGMNGFVIHSVFIHWHSAKLNNGPFFLKYKYRAEFRYVWTLFYDGWVRRKQKWYHRLLDTSRQLVRKWLFAICSVNLQKQCTCVGFGTFLNF